MHTLFIGVANRDLYILEHWLLIFFLSSRILFLKKDLTLKLKINKEKGSQLWMK